VSRRESRNPDARRTCRPPAPRYPLRHYLRTPTPADFFCIHPLSPAHWRWKHEKDSPAASPFLFHLIRVPHSSRFCSGGVVQVTHPSRFCSGGVVRSPGVPHSSRFCSGGVVRVPYPSRFCSGGVVRVPHPSRFCLGGVVQVPHPSRFCSGGVVRVPHPSRFCSGGVVRKTRIHLIPKSLTSVSLESNASTISLPVRVSRILCLEDFGAKKNDSSSGPFRIIPKPLRDPTPSRSAEPSSIVNFDNISRVFRISSLQVVHPGGGRVPRTTAPNPA
jgi:rRNA maturation protein Nop10